MRRPLPFRSGRSRSEPPESASSPAGSRRRASRGTAGARLGVLCLVALAAGSVVAADPSSTPAAAPVPSASLPAAGSADGGGSPLAPAPPRGTSRTLDLSALARTVVEGGAGSGVVLAGGDLSIPPAVLAAYRQAATTIDAEQPDCHLPWPLLAGIGKVESDHGRHGGGNRISANGTISPRIIGPALTGSDDTARITDTDGGRLDGDARLDHAVGPMQFIPSTWARVGRDGNGDGVADPENVADASLSAAAYLCAHDRDLAVPAQVVAAVRAYNPSDSYVRTVLAWAGGYGAADPAALRRAADEAAGSLPGGSVAAAPSTGPAAPAPGPTTAGPSPSGSPACKAVGLTLPGVAAIDASGNVLLDEVDVTTTVTTPAAGKAAPEKYTVATTLRDAKGYVVTTTTTTRTLGLRAAIVARLNGRDVGDAGASGPYRATVVVSRAPGAAGCARPGSASSTATLDAASFDGWTTTMTRLRARLGGFHTAGAVDAPSFAALAPLLPTTATPAQLLDRLAAFRATLAARTKAGGVTAEAATRLDSLAARLLAQTAAQPTPSTGATPTPSSPGTAAPSPSAPVTASPALVGSRGPAPSRAAVTAPPPATAPVTGPSTR